MLTDYEKETIILFNEEEETANIYTYNRNLQERLIAYSAKYPDICRKVKDERDGGMEFDMAKDRLAIKLKPPVSEENKKKYRKNLNI